MKSDVTDALKRMNPVESTPQAAPVEQLLLRLDQSARAFDAAAPVARTSTAGHPRIRLAAGFAAIIAGAAVALVTLGPSGGGTPNVLADVTRALTPGSGVLHMVQVTEQMVAGQTRTTRVETWTAQNPRRLRSIVTSPDGKTFEHAFTASPLENRRWSEEEPDVILHETSNGPLVKGALTHEATPDVTLRELFNKGQLTLAGKTTLEGRAVWELTVHPANYAQPVFEGKQLPDPTMYVDASTFIPVELASESLIHAGETVDGALELDTETTRYTTYEELPAGAQSESLLKLREHPGAVEKNEP
ncbi:MAG TPA: hypothetical protein VIH92_04865 [Solirubrobacteraceae bacterium]